MALILRGDVHGDIDSFLFELAETYTLFITFVQQEDMKREKVYDIRWDEENQWIVMDWDGYASNSEFVEGTEYMYKLILEHRASKILADIKDMTIIARDDQNYIYSFLPRAIEAGFRAIAIVRPVSYFNAVAIETIGYRVNQTNVQMKVFDSRTDAMDWLKSLNF